MLVGESGSGKTTALRLLAGLLEPAEGRIELDGLTYFDSSRNLSVVPHKRPIGYVAQDYALFPHLNVLENVAFGLRALRMPAPLRRASELLERFGITDLAERRPAQLSGGQQQRVALARALAIEPRLLLLDEPLAALDLSTRRVVRAELIRLLAELPCVTIYVTHSPAEALLFGERVTVLEKGRVSQSGARDDLLRHPRSSYVAEFLGLNLYRGVVGSRTDDGLVRVSVEGGELFLAEDAPIGEEIHVVVDPREVVLSTERPQGSARNVFVGPIEEIAPEPPLGERVRVSVGSRPALIAEVTRAAASAMALAPGRMAYASFKATGARAYR